MSWILPTPLLFISGYENKENVFYCLILESLTIHKEERKEIIISDPCNYHKIVTFGFEFL